MRWRSGSQLASLRAWVEEQVGRTLQQAGARYGAFVWREAAGPLWLFGGAGLDADGDAGQFNDLWRIDVP